MKEYSVLMSLYIDEETDYFIKSIESILNQTIKPEQIVIVQDGPLNKDMYGVLNEYKNKYEDLITLVPLKKNIGLGLALNEGLKLCRNELVARMDTDDIAAPHRMEVQLREFENDPDLCILGSSVDEFYDYPENVVSRRTVPLEHEEILKFSRRRSPFNHPTVMYKKSEVIRCGWYRHVLRKEDIELFIRMLNNGCKGKNLDESLLLFRSNESNYERRKTWINCKSYILVIYDA